MAPTSARMACPEAVFLRQDDCEPLKLEDSNIDSNRQPTCWMSVGGGTEDGPKRDVGGEIGVLSPVSTYPFFVRQMGF